MMVCLSVCHIEVILNMLAEWMVIHPVVHFRGIVESKNQIRQNTSCLILP